MAERAYVAAASAAERAECEARFAAASAAALASGAPLPFRGPAADSALGEHFLDVIALVSAHGFALDVLPTRFICGLTFRHGTRRADGSLDRAGFLGGTADMIDCSRRLQAPWLEAARRATRESMGMRGIGTVERTTNLMRAAEAGDARRVRELLTAGAHWRCVDSARRTALHWACERGDARAVEALLAADSASETLNADDASSTTPLIQASFNGHEGAVRALLARGARQELQCEDGSTALMGAVRAGYIGVVEQLCAAPGALAVISLCDNRHCSPYDRALMNNQLAIAAVLRAAEKRLRAEAALAAARAKWAAERAQAEVRFVAACAAAAAAGAPAPFRGPAADSALGERFLDIIALVSANGFALDVRRARFICGRTFRLSARRADGSLGVEGFLGTADAIEHAMRLQAPWLAEELGAKPDENGNTNLMLAAEAGDEQRVRELLAAGVSASGINHFDMGWWTALHFAAAQGDERIVAAVAEAYPYNIYVESEHAETPLMLACENGNEGAARVLLALGAPWDSHYISEVLHYAAHGAFVELLCEAGAEVNEPGRHGATTPLMSAVKRFREDSVRALLARGARQEPQNTYGETAVHIAVLGHNTSATSAGSPAAAASLLRAARSIVELLCAAPGAATALSLRDSSGRTALDCAVQGGHAACAAVLRAHGAV